MSEPFVRIGVPDPSRGFVLANELHSQAHVEAVDDGRSWEVVLDNRDGLLLPDLLSRIEHWLHAEAVQHTYVCVDGVSYLMDGNRRAAP